MKGKNKPDNLEKFFKRVLNRYEEDPGEEFWDRIAPNIPSIPVDKAPFIIKKWMLLFAFVTGIVLSSTFYFWQFNNLLVNNLQENLSQKQATIQQLESDILNLKNKLNQAESGVVDKIPTAFNNKPEPPLVGNSRTVSKSSISVSKNKRQANKGVVIKPEITRTNSVVAAESKIDNSWLQPFFADKEQHKFFFSSKISSISEILKQKSHTQSSLSSNFLAVSKEIFNPYKAATNLTFFKGESLKEKFSKDKETFNANKLPLTKHSLLDISKKYRLLDTKDKDFLAAKSLRKNLNTIGNDELTSFIITSINPFSGLKYNLKGYQPSVSIREVAGVSSAWSWSVTGGFETKKNWTVQVGLDYNKLTMFKENINKIRFNAEDADRVGNGYIFSFNQRSDGAIGNVITRSTVYNQIKNDGQDVEHGDLFPLAVRTEQPIKIVRLPILGGYRFKLHPRFYITPKIGVSAVWKIKEQTQLQSVKTDNDRLSVQQSDIFLTSKTTTESLEAIFRTEIGFRWRSRWYIVAEPRFKYNRNPLYTYKGLELEDAPVQLMIGLRFNVD